MALDQLMRSMGFTATDMAAVFGVDEEQDLHSKYAQKIYGVVSPEPEWFKIGKYLEPAVIEMYRDFTGKKLQVLIDKTFRHPKYPHVMATPDVLIEDGGVMDAKTAKWWQRHKWGADPKDTPYRVQLQMATLMEVLDRDYGEVGLLNGDQFSVIHYPRDREFGEFIVSEAERIWLKYFEAKEPPPIGGSKISGRWLQQMYPTNLRPDLRPATDEEIAQLGKYADVRAALKAGVKEKEALENWLKNAIKDREGVEWPHGRFTWRLQADSHKPDWKSLAHTLMTRHVRLPDNSARDEEAIAELIERHTAVIKGTRHIRLTMDKRAPIEEETSDAA